MAAAAITYLDGDRLARGLRAGIARVLASREHLDRINVFPVADGDTGTNLASTLRSVLAPLQARAEPHAGKLLTAVADAALDGARGNSGAILAQFFQGLSDSAAERPRLSPGDLARGVRTGASYAREAMSNPREGTMLTVMSAYAAALDRNVSPGAEEDFPALLELGLERAREALQRTPELLDVLRRAGVVDAGAQGFVELLEGVHEFVARGALADDPFELPAVGESGEDPGPVVDVDGDDPYRYCTECLVSARELDRRKLRERLSALGASLVIAGTHGKAKVHIHTDVPDEVFREAARFGAVSGQKADDLLQQQSLAHTRGRQFAVLTDTAADIPEQLLTQHGIDLVPLRVHFGDEHYLDKVSITPDRFFRELRRNPIHPTTSQPAPGDLRRQYDFLTSHFRAVVSLHVTAWGSGTWQAARSAAARCSARDQVYVVDSRNVSLGQGLLAVYAAECAEAGFDARETVRALEFMLPRTRTFGVLPDLRFAVRGGRVPGYVKSLADALRVTPVLVIRRSGKVATGGVLFRTDRLAERFARFVARRARAGRHYRLAVGHAADRPAAVALREALLARVPGIEWSCFTEIGTALGAHGGPGTLVAALQEYIAPAELRRALRPVGNRAPSQEVEARTT